jgi:hypothetical protein
MPTNRVSARRRRLLEEILDASHILTDLRRDLAVFCTTTLGYHAVLGRLPQDPEKAYLKGMRKAAERLKELLDKRRKPAWQERWAEERRQRMAQIARIQRRQEGVRINLLPEPESPEVLNRFLRMSTDAQRMEKLDRKRAALLRELKKCDLATEGGRFRAEAIVAEIEENDKSLKSVQIDMAVDWIVALRIAAEKLPKGDVKPIPPRESLMLAYNEANMKVSAYRVSSADEEVGKTHLEKETQTRIIAVYESWEEAARFGLDWQSAPRFTVTEYTSGEARCAFDVDLS